ncbi:MAG: putative ABC transport system ATP-binding protein [Planctomycetota bacterium]|jgi:putative ABC transport system ATP-binding protein
MQSTDHQTGSQIECIGVSHSLRSGSQDLQILDSVNLTVQSGEFLAIVGPSGSGKSTLLGLLAGLEKPSEGSIRFEGLALEQADEDQLALWRREKVGFVFQNFQLLSNMTARENIMLPLELLGRKDAFAVATQLLEDVGLSERGHHYPSQLSGGEQQRVALARAFGHEPAVLFADEPTGNLDQETGAQALQLLLRLREQHGTTLLLVTHDDALAQRAQRRVRIVGGRLHEETTQDETTQESSTEGTHA